MRLLTKLKVLRVASAVFVVLSLGAIVSSVLINLASAADCVNGWQLVMEHEIQIPDADVSDCIIETSTSDNAQVVITKCNWRGTGYYLPTCIQLYLKCGPVGVPTPAPTPKPSPRT